MVRAVGPSQSQAANGVETPRTVCCCEICILVISCDQPCVNGRQPIKRKGGEHGSVEGSSIRTRPGCGAGIRENTGNGRGKVWRGFELQHCRWALPKRGDRCHWLGLGGR